MSDDRNAATTLDEIRQGAVKALSLMRQRIAEVTEALDEGRFTDACERCAELYGGMGPLAAAEASFATLTRSSIIRAEDVEVGMHVGKGKVTDKDVTRHQCLGHKGEHTIIVLTWENGEAHSYNGSDQVVVRDGEE